MTSVIIQSIATAIVVVLYLATYVEVMKVEVMKPSCYQELLKRNN